MGFRAKIKFMKNNENIRVERGEIYWCELDKGFGSEQGNRRPVLIIQNDIGNRFSPTTIIAPITSISNNKKTIPTHVNIDKNDTYFFGLHKNSIVLLEQIKVVDKKRLGAYIGRFSETKMLEVDKALSISLAI